MVLTQMCLAVLYSYDKGKCHIAPLSVEGKCRMVTVYTAGTHGSEQESNLYLGRFPGFLPVLHMQTCRGRYYPLEHVASPIELSLPLRISSECL